MASNPSNEFCCINQCISDLLCVEINDQKFTKASRKQGIFSGNFRFYREILTNSIKAAGRGVYLG